MKITARCATLLSVLLLALVTASCEDTYESMYLNPDKTTETRVEYLFTDAVLATNPWVHYWEGWYRIYGDIAQWTQVTGTVNDVNMMDYNKGRWDATWTKYYTERIMRVLEMHKVYGELPEAQQKPRKVYLILGKILNAYNTARATDLWGVMPYTEAFTARAPSPEKRNIFPSYDTQELIYNAILDSLKTAEAALRELDPAAVHGELETQDIFLDGDLMQWRRFANSLRLRLAMRLSEVAPEKARQIAGEILTGDSPLVETNENNIIWRPTEEHDSYGQRGRAVRERGDATYAPKLMLGFMKAAGDPRIPVFFDPNWNGEYVGLPSSPAEQPATISREQFAAIDSLMYAQNSMIPHFVVTATEVNLLKAEAFLRGWAPGSAAEAYSRALRQSVEAYYWAYNLNPDAPDMEMPPSDSIEAFISNSSASWDASASFEEKFRDIAVQKWIHFNHMQPYEAWNTLRRTDYPNLPPDKLEGGQVLQRTVRITYPTSEVANNRESYQEVAAQDMPTHHVWWDVE